MRLSKSTVDVPLASPICGREGPVRPGIEVQPSTPAFTNEHTIMKKIIVSSTVAAGLLLSASTAMAADVVYDVMPADEGNFWLLHELERPESGPSVHGLETVEFTQSSYVGDGWYSSVLEGIFGTGSVPFWDHYYGGTAWTHAGDYNWTAMLDINSSYGDMWTMDAGPCKTYEVEYINGANVTGPAGEFVSPFTYNFGFMPDPTVRCGDVPVQQVSFAEGVGPVQIQREYSSSNLLFARVDGDVVAQAAGATEYNTADIALTVAMVEDEIVQPHPIYCFTTPCPQPAETIRFAMIIENLGTTTQTFGFDYDGDGIDDAATAFEFDVFDASGHVVSYSDQFTGPDELEPITLAPGEREVVLLDMPAATADGESVLNGDYQGVAIFNGRYADGAGFSKLDVDFSATLP